MEHDSNRAIITYGLSENENEIIHKLSNIKNFSHPRIIEKFMCGTKIKHIVREDKDKYKESNIPEEKVVLFNNLSEDDLNGSIKFIRENFKEGPIFAVVTKTSYEWTFNYLIEHLIREREWFKKQGRIKK